MVSRHGTITHSRPANSDAGATQTETDSMLHRFEDYHFTSEYLAKTLASKLTLDEAGQEAIWTYTAVEVPGRNAWTVDVYDEDGIRLGAL